MIFLVLTTCDKDSDESAQLYILNTAFISYSDIKLGSRSGMSSITTFMLNG